MINKLFLSALLLVLTFTVHAQTKVSGKVTDASTGDPLPGVNIYIKGTVKGTITDLEGQYDLKIAGSTPLVLVFSYVGYEKQEIEISNSSMTKVDVKLSEATFLSRDVVVSASRVEESILKSPVSVERMNILDIQNAPTPDFYSALKNMNGVDFSTQSLTFKSVNARGFGANGNNRFVQMIDGIDNQAPGLNFSVGNVVGISDLDLESAEMIPGAASALYGPNAIQGILLMRSKSPFDYQGLDIYAKAGVNHVDKRDHPMALYSDYGMRYAKAFNDKFAFKIVASYLKAEDFIGVDYRDQSLVKLRQGTIEQNLKSNRSNNRFYDGINTYGDFIFPIARAAGLNPKLKPVASYFPTGTDGLFSPKGYRERDVVDNGISNLKFGTALHYRLTNKIEMIGQFNYGVGNSVYTANDRFILDGFSIWTGKLELKSDNFFVRAYTTQENSGDSYAANTAISLINQKKYLPDYIGAFIQSRLNGANYAQSHDLARAFADKKAEAYKPGTQAFTDALSDIRSKSIAKGGAKFLDRSALWHFEGSYNFKNQIDFADIVVGANYRMYQLNSEGTLFALDDNNKEVTFGEYGGYVQVAKDILDNLKLQGSVRYDKNENFKGQFSPRVSAVWEFLPNQNLRASFQRGFRIPTTQDQYIDLDVQTRRLIGRNDILRKRYNIDKNPVYTTESVVKAQASGKVTDLVKAPDAYKPYKTEKVDTWEVGYKGLLFDEKLMLDIYYYNSVYSDFGAEVDITQAVDIADIKKIPAGYGSGSHSDALKKVFLSKGGDPSKNIKLQRYGYDTNIDTKLNAHGFGVSAEYAIYKSYTIKGNTSYNELLNLDDIVAKKYNVAYNTPKWRYNVSVGNRKLTKNLGFGISYRWQDAFLWQSSIGSGVIPAYGTLDAQVTYRIPNIGARVKIGGSNILNKRYTTSLANPSIGALYYVQINFDNIINQLKK